MRIAVDARPLAAPTTGIGRYTRALLRAWPRGEDTFLLYGHGPLPEPDTPAAYRVRHGPLRSEAPGTPFARLRFGRWAREDDADLFWSPRHHLPGGLGSVPAIVTVHDLAWLRVPETMRRRGRWSERVLTPDAIRRARFVVTDCETIRRELSERFPDAAPRTRVVPAASGLELPRTGDRRNFAPPEGPFVLFVGTMEPRKNLGRVVEAFGRLHADRRLDHRLVVVGNPGWKDRDARSALEASPVRDRIEVRGRLGDAELAVLYERADFLVAPSLYEGFGLQLVEAFTFGIPVVTGDRSAMPEIAGDAGLLVDPLSISAIRDAMERLVTDRPLRHRLAEAARIRAGAFSWRRSAASLSALFDAAAVPQRERVSHG